MGLWLVGYSALHLRSVSGRAMHPFLLTAILNLGHSNFQLGSLPALTRPRYVQWNLYQGGNGILAILEGVGAFY